MKDEHKWLVIEDESGWTVVIPDFDIKPHGFPQNGKDGVELAGFDCPCGVKVDWENKIIIHESFTYRKRIEDSMNRLSTEKPLQKK